MSWIIPAEIFNTATRVKGISIATMVSFLFNTMIGQVTTVALAKVGWRFYLLFVVCNFSNAVFFYLFEPETRGVTVRNRILAQFRSYGLLTWEIAGADGRSVHKLPLDRIWKQMDAECRSRRRFNCQEERGWVRGHG